MLKAGALYYTIVIALLMAILSAMLILYTQLYFIETSYYHSEERLISNAQSGAELLKSNSIQGFDSGKEMDLYGNVIDSVFLKKQLWGIYDVCVSVAHKGKRSVAHIAVNGCIPMGEYTSLALYLTDHNIPLGYCGAAHINGTARLPRAGTRLNFIEGKSFVGSTFVSGSTEHSEGLISILNATKVAQVEAQINSKQEIDTIILPTEDQKPYKRSFTQATARLDMGTKATLGAVELSGNIRITASQQIVISKSAKLEYVVVIAPKVEVEEGFEGKIQILATDTVIIHTRAKLNYPSAIFMKGASGSTSEHCFIKVESEASIDGEVYLCGDKEAGKRLIEVYDKAIIKGLVYDNGRLMLKGKVEGMVICDKFYYRSASAIYDNQLLDGQINREALDGNFLFSNLIFDSRKINAITQIYE